MIITVQGNYGKKNKCVLAAALLGGMAAVTNGSKTLILQLIDKDMDSIESMFTGLSKDTNTFGKNDGTTSFANEGIDALLRAADNTKLTTDDFKQYCTSFNKKDHGLDVTQMTEINNFREVCKTKIESVKKICKNAKEYYENIFILMPTGDEELSRAINGDREENEGFADMSIYCLKQGHTKTEHYFGRKIIFLVTDFDSASKFSLKSMRKIYCQKGDSIYKIERNVGCNDAYLSGKLLEFILTNRDLREYDTNYQWAKDVKAVVNQIENLDAKDDPMDYGWEKLLIEEEKHLRTLPETVVDINDFGSRKLEEEEEKQQKQRATLVKNKNYEESPVAETDPASPEEAQDSEIENEKLEECNEPESVEEFEPVDFTDEESAQENLQQTPETEIDGNNDFVLEVDGEENYPPASEPEKDDEYLKKLYEETSDQMLREAFKQDKAESTKAAAEASKEKSMDVLTPEDEKRFEKYLAKKLSQMFGEQEMESVTEEAATEEAVAEEPEPVPEETTETTTDTADDWSSEKMMNSDENSDENGDTIQQMQSQMDQLSRQFEELKMLIMSQTRG